MHLGAGIVAAKEERRNDGHRRDFSIGEVALWIVAMGSALSMSSHKQYTATIWLSMKNVS
jgi:hypothetical protein